MGHWHDDLDVSAWSNDLPVLLSQVHRDVAQQRLAAYPDHPIATARGYSGHVAMPADADQTAYERAGYVDALQAANNAQGPW